MNLNRKLAKQAVVYLNNANENLDKTIEDFMVLFEYANSLFSSGNGYFFFEDDSGFSHYVSYMQLWNLYSSRSFEAMMYRSMRFVGYIESDNQNLLDSGNVYARLYFKLSNLEVIFRGDYQSEMMEDTLRHIDDSMYFSSLDNNGKIHFPVTLVSEIGQPFVRYNETRWRILGCLSKHSDFLRYLRRYALLYLKSVDTTTIQW